MNKTLLTLAVLFTTVLANAQEHLTPVLHPDTQFDGKNYMMLGLIAVTLVCVGIFLLVFDKKLKNELKNKN